MQTGDVYSEMFFVTEKHSVYGCSEFIQLKKFFKRQLNFGGFFCDNVLNIGSADKSTDHGLLPYGHR